MPALDLTEAKKAIAVLAANIRWPAHGQHGSGMYKTSHQIIIPRSADNNALGAALDASFNAQNIIITINPGDSSSG